MTYSFDVELFIKEVQSHPQIWDLHCEDYKFKNKKNHAWGAIAKVFIQDYEDMGLGEKYEVCKKLQGKWRNLRDSFVRYVKNKNCRKSNYMYARSLAFLKEIYNNDLKSEDDSSEDDLSNKKRKYEIIKWSSEDEIKKKTKKRETNDFPASFPEPEYVETTMINSDDAACSFPTEDEDRSFFESLLPAVRKFDLDQKLEFRSEVLNLVKNIRNGPLCTGSVSSGPMNNNIKVMAAKFDSEYEIDVNYNDNE